MGYEGRFYCWLRQYRRRYVLPPIAQGRGTSVNAARSKRTNFLKVLLVALVAALFAAVVLLVSEERTGAQEQQQSYTVTDLGTVPGGFDSGASGINGSGQVVGWAYYNSNQQGHAFLYENAQMDDLGALPGGSYSAAYAINDSGQVVGYALTSSEQEHAFLYENAQMVDLNDRIPADSGWVLQYATEINDEGQIVGNGVHNGQRRAFLLTPSYPFQGFYQPVDNPPTINVAKAGVGIPVKFSLGGDQGLDIFAADYPKSQRIACDSTAPIDRIEQTVTTGASNISYDVATGQYTYVWKTRKAWKGTCRQFTMKLDDGTVHRANFKFK